jgi:hypothetical protein
VRISSVREDGGASVAGWSVDLRFGVFVELRFRVAMR